MCTEPCNKIYCANYGRVGHDGEPVCRGVLYKDRRAGAGHFCKTARRAGRRGLCKTGVVWNTYERVSPDEVCLACELAPELRLLRAETCDEAAADPLEGLYGPCCGGEYEEDTEDGGVPVAGDIDTEEGGAPVAGGNDTEDGGVPVGDDSDNEDGGAPVAEGSDGYLRRGRGKMNGGRRAAVVAAEPTDEDREDGGVTLV